MSIKKQVGFLPEIIGQKSRALITMTNNTSNSSILKGSFLKKKLVVKSNLQIKNLYMKVQYFFLSCLAILLILHVNM